jgi:protein SDA1
MGWGVFLTANLPQLQNLIKRDPQAYREEFLQQWNHYNSIRLIVKINLGEQAQHFKELVTFISQVIMHGFQPASAKLNLSIGRFMLH